MVTNPRLIPFSIASDTGELADANQILNDSANQTGLLNNAANQQIVNDRIDATGLGAPIFAFTGSYEATAANSSEWFNGQANRHLQGASGQANGLRTFTLPGTSIMNTIMDTLSAAGLPELYRLTISYLGGVAGASVSVNRLNIVARTTGNPQIDGRASVTLAHGDTATFEISRTASVLSSYNVIFEGRLQGSPAGDTLDDIQLQTQTPWDATDGAALPTGVLQGYAYKVVNAPTDGSGRFGEVLYTDDWVVWEAATFTQWSDTANWFVIAAGDVRRLTLAGQQFLEDVGTQTRDVRGAQFDGSAQDRNHWFRIYDQASDYTPGDLNASTDEASITTTTARDNARLAIRFAGTNATIATLLTTLYAYEEDPFGNFHLIGNLSTDFTFEGDFGSESDYLANQEYNFHANSTIRLYFQTTRTLNTISDYDAVGNIDNGTITEEKLSTELRDRIGTTGVPNLALDEQRIAALEARQTTLFPLAPDVHKLTEWSDIFEPEATAATVTEAPGYSLLVDYRGGGTRYASTGIVYSVPVAGTVRYTGLGTNQYRTFGFRVAGAADETLLWLRDGATSIPFVRITALGRIQINNYIPPTVQDQRVSDATTFLTLTAGSATLTTAAGSVATYTATRFPVGATAAFRSMQIDIDVLVNGVDTQAAGFVSFALPAANTAQSRREVTRSINLGPLYGNRLVEVTIGYTLRVSGDDLLIDINYITGPADVTIELRDVADLRTFTAPAAVPRVDQWVSFSDQSGLYTLAGDTNFAITFQPHASQNTENAVAVARNAAGVISQFNDISVPIPEAGFDAIEIQTAGAFTGSEFRTFAPDHFLRHSDVAALLPNSAQRWCYGLADERTVTEHAVTQAVDFTLGFVIPSPDGSRWSVTIDNAGTLTTTKLP